LLIDKKDDESDESDAPSLAWKITQSRSLNIDPVEHLTQFEISDKFANEDHLFADLNAAIKDVKFLSPQMCYIALRKDFVFFKVI
jgi:hypothetical protein